MKPVKVGVIGIGNMGWNHARVLSLLRDAELVGVADPDAARGALATEQFGCRWFADYNDLIAEVEAVCIAVPTLLHHPVGMACLKAGVHVLIEKPIAANEQEAGELIAAADGLRSLGLDARQGFWQARKQGRLQMNKLPYDLQETHRE